MIGTVHRLKLLGGGQTDNSVLRKRPYSLLVYGPANTKTAFLTSSLVPRLCARR
ncbi:uncharacterized protein ARMOST_19851 [Armillaria ostoyae]|uniref:Uncharacterized protein n=1 Tax=Armillaria ostoyae TaxID=47428 RepID=A0A284S5R4_ARMOS|nr:uncharacterized protein ARMOST_19851 [Armillaria ostoyae]